MFFNALKRKVKDKIKSYLIKIFNYLYHYYSTQSTFDLKKENSYDYITNINNYFLIAAKENNKDNTVLIVESNTFHGELLQGYAKYFIDMNYNIEFLLNKRLYDLKPLDKFESYLCHTFSTGLEFIVYLNLFLQKNYVYIFFNSDYFYIDGHYLNLYTAAHKQDPRLLFISHSENILRNELKIAEGNYYFQNRKIFSLSGYNPSTRVLPLFFNKPINQINDKKIITSVGIYLQISNNSQKTFFDLVEKCINLNIRWNIIIREYSFDIPEHLNKYITVYKNPAYDVLYSLINNSYALINTYDESDFHDYYINKNTVTGNLLFSLVYNKPLILPSKFSTQFYLNDDCAFLYDDEIELFDVINNYLFNKSIYADKLVNLKKLHDAYYFESFENLKNCL
jgi:hypothetical protein